jgi:ubiquitin-activating enzyme E1
MTQLNDSKASRAIRVINPFKFSIDDTSGYSPYSGSGGYFQQVKQPKKFTFSALTTLLEVGADLPICSEVWGRTRSLHVLNLALSEFQTAHDGALPAPTSSSDAAEVLALAKTIAAKLDIELLEAVITNLARCAGCVISPMCAFLGGIVGQVMIACVYERVYVWMRITY